MWETLTNLAVQLANKELIYRIYRHARWSIQPQRTSNSTSTSGLLLSSVIVSKRLSLFYPIMCHFSAKVAHFIKWAAKLTGVGKAGQGAV